MPLNPTNLSSRSGATRWLRSYGAPMGLLLAGLMLLVLWAYLVRTSPSFTVQTQTIEETALTLTTGFHYEVELTTPTLVWSAGTILESDRVLYPYPGSPVIRIQPYVQTNTYLERRVDLVPEVTVEAWGKTLTGEPVWSLPISVGPFAHGALDLTGKESEEWMGQPVELSVDTLRAQLQAIREELGFVQIAHGVQVRLVLRGQVEAAGRTDEIHLSTLLPFTFEGQGFSVQPLSKSTLTNERKISKEVEIIVPIALSSRMLTPWHLLLGGAASLTAAAGLVTMRRRQANGVSDLPEHHRFKAWITEGAISSDGAIHTEVHSLEGLVDLAIDMNKRVIFDRSRGGYHVLDGDILYTYWSPQRETAGPGKSRRLGELLIMSGVVTSDQVKNALEFQKILHRPMGECLIALDFVDEMTLYTTLATQGEMVYLELDPDGMVIDPQWLERLSIKRARLLQVLPLGLRPDGRLTIAIANPLDNGIEAALTELLEHPVSVVVSSPSMIRSCLDRAEAGTLVSLPPHPIEELADHPGDRLTRVDLVLLQEMGQGESVPLELILKAAGHLEDDASRHLMDADKTLRQALIESAGVHPDAVQLAVGAQVALMGMRSHGRAEWEIDLVDLLIHSSRLPVREAERWREQAQAEGRPVEVLLLETYLLSHGTWIRARRILAGLRRLRAARRLPQAE